MPTAAQEPPAAAQEPPAAAEGAIAAEDPLAEARRLLESGMPVTAADLLSRSLSDGRAAGPEAVLLAAQAHASYGDWTSVRRLLSWQPWLAEESGRLLARAYLELDSAGRAVEVYEWLRDRGARGPPGGGVGGTPPPRPREAAETAAGQPTGQVALEAAVGHAIALDRSGRPAEAAAGLLQWLEGRSEPDAFPVRWLRLEALRLLSAAADTTAVVRLAAELLRDRVLPADTVRAQVALAAFRAGDPGRGIALARQVKGAARAALDGDWVGPELLAAGDSTAARVAFRRALDGGHAPEAVGAALMVLDSGWRALADVGRADLRQGRARRAREALAEALRIAPEPERAALAERLAAAHGAEGDHAGALAVLSPWLEGPASATVAAERRASLWMAAYGVLTRLGRDAEAEAALERAAEAGEGAAAFASFLVADRRHDRGELAAARTAYLATAARFPRTRFAELALARLGMQAFLEDRPAVAVEHFQTYRRRYPRGEWYQGAIYWTARAREVTGETEAARALYREALGHAPLTYYGILAADRLGTDFLAALAPRPAAEPRPGPAAEALLDRMETLRRLGWSDRARAELRAASAPSGLDERLALALALNRSGWTSEGVRRAWAVQGRSSRWTLPLLRAVYPLPYAEALRRSAEERGLEPAFVAAVVRRESMFDREIISTAGAVGLMQLMPATARAAARPAGLPDLHLDQLTVPEVSLRLGTWYLAEMLDRFGGSRVAALASYNAGPHRWLVWRDFPERSAGEDVLIERIPFRETREYVRAVQALERVYERLHPEALGIAAEPVGPAPPTTVDPEAPGM